MRILPVLALAVRAQDAVSLLRKRKAGYKLLFGLTSLSDSVETFGEIISQRLATVEAQYLPLLSLKF